jgi:hypothetical protein
MNVSNFIGAVTFWRTLEHLADPESRTRLHARGVLERTPWSDGPWVAPRFHRCVSRCICATAAQCFCSS